MTSNTNRGAIFVNERKEPNSRQPDRRGSVNVEGVDYWISGWLEKDRDGKPYLSISLQKKDVDFLSNKDNVVF